jgi:hypothetical protein
VAHSSVEVSQPMLRAVIGARLMPDQSMSARVQPVRLTADWAGWQAIGEVVRVGSDIREIIRRPCAGVQVELLDRDIDLSSIVKAGLVFGPIATVGNTRDYDGRDDPQNHYDGEQFHERKRRSILMSAIHCRIRCTTCREDSARGERQET